MHEPERMAYTLRELGEAFGLHADTIYREIRSGKLAAVKVRGRTMILRDAVIAWRASLPRFGGKT